MGINNANRLPKPVKKNKMTPMNKETIMQPMEMEPNSTEIKKFVCFRYRLRHVSRQIRIVKRKICSDKSSDENSAAHQTPHILANKTHPKKKLKSISLRRNRKLTTPLALINKKTCYLLVWPCLLAIINIHSTFGCQLAREKVGVA